jgi:hypothetical protein
LSRAVSEIGTADVAGMMAVDPLNWTEHGSRRAANEQQGLVAVTSSSGAHRRINGVDLD